MDFFKKKSFEKQKTRTDFNISAIRKLSFSLFGISGLVNFFCELFFIEPGKDKYSKIFSAGGIVFNQNYILILNFFTPLITDLIDIEGICKRFLQGKLMKKVDFGYPIIFT